MAATIAPASSHQYLLAAQVHDAWHALENSWDREPDDADLSDTGYQAWVRWYKDDFRPTEQSWHAASDALARAVTGRAAYSAADTVDLADGIIFDWEAAHK